MDKIILHVREELTKLGEEKNRESSLRFFKEDIKTYGVRNPDVRKLGKEIYKEINQLTKSEIFALCEKLWQSGTMEECLMACHWSYNKHKEYDQDDFQLFEKWTNKYITNWATCDTFCNHNIGSLVVKYPGLIKELKSWTKSDNRWVRRASAVSLVVPARKGQFLSDILEIADLLLMDKDDMVQKGYGWMLKETSKAHQKEIFDYIMDRKTFMPRTSLRYAIEKMPDALRKKAMEK